MSRDPMAPHDGESWRDGEHDEFDAWLRRALWAAYGPTAAEPVPEELLWLLEAAMPADVRPTPPVETALPAGAEA